MYTMKGHNRFLASTYLRDARWAIKMYKITKDDWYIRRASKYFRYYADYKVKAEG